MSRSFALCAVLLVPLACKKQDGTNSPNAVKGVVDDVGTEVKDSPDTVEDVTDEVVDEGKAVPDTAEGVTDDVVSAPN